MNNLDDLERTILSDARAFIEPTAADKAQVFDRLVLGLGGAATVSAIAASRHGAFTQLQRWLVTRKGVALSCALLGAGAGFGAGFVVGQNKPRAGVSAPARFVENPNIENAGVAAAKSSDEAPNHEAKRVRAPDESPAALTAASAGVVALGTASAGVAHQHSPNTESENNASSLPVSDPIGDELALLKRAERAIRAQNSLLALGLLRELEQRFPRGKLLDERAAARVMAECLQQSPEAARRTGEAYLRGAKSGVYHERVRRLCGISDGTSNLKDVSSKDSGSPETNPDVRRSR